MGKITKNISPSELQCSCCGMNNAQLELVDMVQEFAGRADSKLRINSACRCKANNDSVGSNDDSMHRMGIAADVVALGCSHEEACYIAKKLHYEGKIGGLILYPTFIHLDCRRYRYLKDKR